MVVSDKEASRRFIAGIVSDIPGTEVIDTAAGGRIALAKLRRFPTDLVLLDFEMSGADSGLNTMKKIREAHQDVEVLIVSTATGQSQPWRVDEIVAALEAGAIDFVPKPLESNENTIREFRLRLLTILGLLGARRNFRIARYPKELHVPASEMTDSGPGSETVAEKYVSARAFRHKSRMSPIEVIAIAVSTGGPNALAKVIPLLPENLGVPVLVVQHIPSPFTASLAASLNMKSAIRVREAAEGEEVMPNTVYIAPGGRHTLVRKETGKENSLPVRRYIRLSDDPPENSVRPSADVLFRSLPDAYKGILSVIMTGMGSDGMKGVRAMKQKGCYCLSQTAETCTVYGMPRAVDESDLSDEKVPLERLANRIISLIED